MHVQVRNGHIKRITDNDIQSLVLEIVGTNVRYDEELELLACACSHSQLVATVQYRGFRRTKF